MVPRRLTSRRKCARPKCPHLLPADAATQMRYHDNACRVRHQRERQGIPDEVIDELERAEQRTAQLPKMSELRKKEER